MEELVDIVSNGKRVGWGFPVYRFAHPYVLWKLVFTEGTGATAHAIEQDGVIRYTFTDEHGCHRAWFKVEETRLHLMRFEVIEEENELQQPLELLVSLLTKHKLFSD